MIGVLLVDDHLQFRQAAGELIEATPGFELLGEATCGEEAMRMVEQLDPALVMLDVRLPGMDGIDTARRITSVHTRPCFLFRRPTAPICRRAWSHPAPRHSSRKETSAPARSESYGRSTVGVTSPAVFTQPARGGARLPKT